MKATDRQLPIFVYGTLRPGGALYPQVRDFVERHESALMGGFDLYSFGMFPGIVHGNGTVEGDLLYIHEDKWAECLAELDRIEANGYLFIRTDIYAANKGMYDIVRVWVYVANMNVLSTDQRIESNDWFRR